MMHFCSPHGGQLDIVDINVVTIKYCHRILVMQMYDDYYVHVVLGDQFPVQLWSLDTMC